MANVRGTRVVGDGNKPVIETIVPSVDWTEDSNGHYLLVDLPEFKKEQVKVQLIGSSGHVKVSGERATNQNKQVRFEETYKVPGDNLSLDKIAAKFDDGILYVTFPKQVEIAEKKRDETTTTTTSTATIEKKKNVSGGGDAAEEQTQQKPHGHDDEHVKKPDDDQSHGNNGQSKIEEKLDGNSSTRLPKDSSSSVKKWEDEEGYLRTAMKTLRKSRGVIVTALVAFSLGVVLSRMLEPPRIENIT